MLVEGEHHTYELNIYVAMYTLGIDVFSSIYYSFVTTARLWLRKILRLCIINCCNALVIIENTPSRTHKMFHNSVFMFEKNEDEKIN